MKFSSLDLARRLIIPQLLLLLLFVINPAQAQMLDSLDKAILDSALSLLKLRPDELGFDKMWVEDDTFKLDIVGRMLDHPLELPGYVDETSAAIDTFSASGDIANLLNFMSAQLKVELKDSKRNEIQSEPFEFNIVDPLESWLKALDRAEPLRREFYQELDSLDLNDLIISAPTLWSEDEDSIKSKLAGAWQFELGIEVDTSKEIDSDRLLDIIAKLDTRPLHEAAIILASAAWQIAEGCASADFELKGNVGTVPGASGDLLFYADTKFGRMVIGGTGNNVYEGDFAALIDLGGDDVYRGRFGGAFGELGQPYSLLIDLKGNDLYDATDLPVSHGAGFFGVGILIDKEGNDSYRSGAYSQGAGLFGVGLLIDGDGGDDYRGQFFMQGAGHCGIGLLSDGGEGDDRYFASAWAQGFASTYGYGLLFDEGGDETYRTGGTYYHAPLLPHDYRSFSGGFGMGWRPRAGGGIGVLYDKGDGNDFYNAEVMSFGSSYWYSIGILVDGGGNDHYSLAQYGLGSGIHLSVGALYDKSGDDQYSSRYGVVGATPHDLSVGMMVDGSGDDYYIVSDGWGASLTNSFGLFIDRLGNDTYATRGGGYSFGNPRWARGFAGAAIFLDLEGDDVYPAGEMAKDSSIWIRSGWGIGMDLARDVIASEKEEEVGEIELTAEDSAKTVEELFEEAAKWEVGSARKSVARARKALIAKGYEAIEYMVEEKLDSKSSLERRLFDKLVDAMPDSAGPLLLAKFESTEDETILKNSAALLGKIKYEDAVEPMLEILKDKKRDKVHNNLISALGKIEDQRAAKPLSKYVTHDMERRRIAAVNALKSINDSTTIPALILGLDDRMFTVRSAAAGALIKFGTSSVYDLRNYISDGMALYPETGLRALGRIISATEKDQSLQAAKLKYEAVLLFERNISHPDAQIRAAAVDALFRCSGDAGRRLVESRMESEYSPVVLAAYKKVLEEFKAEK